VATVRFVVEEAGCPSCAVRVRTALQDVGSVEAVEIDESTDVALVRLRGSAIAPAAVATALREASLDAGHAYRVREGSWSEEA
jgi:copper chaperone CopZ